MIDVIRDFLARSGAVLRAVAGVPDFQGYLAHMRAAHPGSPVMSEAEFSVARTTERYDRVGSRCC